MSKLDGIKARLERITKRLESWDGRDPARVRATTVEAEDDFGIFNVRNYHGSYISALDAAAEQFLDTTPTLIAAIEAVEHLHQQVEGYAFGAIPGAAPDYPVSSTCFTEDEHPEPWPCPTVKAITAALEVTS